jgi:NAD(P)-dependent dehydrogenase (short-subunit alcohol dehydrogenase family)
VTVEEEWKFAMESILQVFGKLDILVNNSGKNSHVPLESSTLSTLQEVMATNVEGVYLGVRYAAEVMKKNPNGGSIVNITSVASQITVPSLAHYSTSKAAAEHFTRVAALEYAPYKIRINAVAPGPTLTEMFEHFISLAVQNGIATSVEEFLQKEAERTPLKMIGDVDDIAQPILFLVGDEAKFITGISIVADGGAHLNN